MPRLSRIAGISTFLPLGCDLRNLGRFSFICWPNMRSSLQSLHALSDNPRVLPPFAQDIWYTASPLDFLFFERCHAMEWLKTDHNILGLIGVRHWSFNRLKTLILGFTMMMYFQLIVDAPLLKRLTLTSPIFMWLLIPPTSAPSLSQTLLCST